MEDCLKSLLSIHFLDKSSPTCCLTDPWGECGVIARLPANPLLKVLWLLSLLSVRTQQWHWIVCLKGIEPFPTSSLYLEENHVINEVSNGVWSWFPGFELNYLWFIYHFVFMGSRTLALVRTWAHPWFRSTMHFCMANNRKHLTLER